jgi:hypothetical protein
MPISHEDTPVTPTGPYLPELPAQPRPEAPTELGEPAPTPGLWDVRTLSAPQVSRAATRKRRGRRPFAVFLLVGGLGSWGIYRTHVVQEALTSSALDGGEPTPFTVVATTAPTANPLLPDIVYVRPAYRVANFVETSRTVGVEGGVPIDENIVVTVEMDYVTPIASFLIDAGSTGSVAGEQLILTSDYIYGAVGAAGEPWVRLPPDPEMTALAAIGYLKMYHEVVTTEVRFAATDVIVTSDVVHGIPVTTYQFDVPWNMLSEFIDPTSSSDPIVRKKAADFRPVGLRLAHVTLSVDTDGLIRMADYQLDEQAWIDAAAAAPGDLVGDVHTRIEIVSTSNEPSIVVPPESFIDAPAG